LVLDPVKPYNNVARKHNFQVVRGPAQRALVLLRNARAKGDAALRFAGVLVKLAIAAGIRATCMIKLPDSLPPKGTAQSGDRAENQQPAKQLHMNMYNQ